MPFIPLDTVKTRVGISLADTTKDTELGLLIAGVQDRFEGFCGRGLRANLDVRQEFRADERSLLLDVYPLREVTKFERKEDEATGWVEITPKYLLRRWSIIQFTEPLGGVGELARVLYKGGYASPGDTGAIMEGCAGLPEDVQWAAAEQAAHWWLWKDKVGLWRHAVSGGTELELRPIEMLPQVMGLLRRYRRYGMI